MSQNKKIIKNALIDSIAAVAYVALISVLLTNSRQLFGQVNSVISGIAFLLTFVFSAALMGIVIFGKPILWYLDGFKKEAVKLVLYSMGFLFVILVLVLLTLIV